MQLFSMITVNIKLMKLAFLLIMCAVFNIFVRMVIMVLSHATKVNNNLVIENVKKKKILKSTYRKINLYKCT